RSNGLPSNAPRCISTEKLGDFLDSYFSGNKSENEEYSKGLESLGQLSAIGDKQREALQ
ncbi:10298_t:CDS:1, partial [Acaulospora colombiana]